MHYLYDLQVASSVGYVQCYNKGKLIHFSLMGQRVCPIKIILMFSFFCAIKYHSVVLILIHVNDSTPDRIFRYNQGIKFVLLSREMQDHAIALCSCFDTVSFQVTHFQVTMGQFQANCEALRMKISVSNSQWCFDPLQVRRLVAARSNGGKIF